MIKNAKIVLSVFLLFIYFKGVAQRNLSLDEALFLMRENSLEFKSIQRNARIEKVQYAIYKNSFLPRVDLNVSLPTYSRAINSITQPNGENTFIEQSQANSTFDFNISQKIPLTGGTLILNSSINRLDLISSNRTSFSSNWFNVLLNQPLNGYNIYKWGKKINKVKFDKNNIDIYKDLESLRNDLVNLFFSVYLSEKKIELTKNNINLTNEYLNISEEKLKQGRILEADVIKVRLSLNQLKSKLENDQLKLDRLTIYDFKRELFEEEKTFIEYVNNVKTLWITKFILRETTLYDFFLKEPLFRE